MKKSTYANELGISPSQLSQWLPQGLPGPPHVKAGLAWIAKNKAQRSRRGSKKPATAKPERKAMPSRAPASGGDTWADRVERARQTERQTHASYLDALARGDTAQLERLLSSHSRAVAEVAKTESLASEASQENGDVVKRSDAERVMEQLLRPLREALDKLPLNERTNCNPQQPEIAERALTEWRDRLLIRASSAENAFKPCH